MESLSPGRADLYSRSVADWFPSGRSNGLSTRVEPVQSSARHAHSEVAIAARHGLREFPTTPLSPGISLHRSHHDRAADSAAHYLKGKLPVVAGPLFRGGLRTHRKADRTSAVQAFSYPRMARVSVRFSMDHQRPSAYSHSFNSNCYRFQSIGESAFRSKRSSTP